LTVDEELSSLDDAVRRLKVEYDIFFGGGSKRPPADLEWRVQSLIKRFSDSQKMNFGQRFRYNSIVQRYAIQNALWQQKLKVKEEGYRRPQDALLSIQGMRFEEEKQAAAELQATAGKLAPEPFVMVCTDPDADRLKVRALYEAMVDFKSRLGEPPPTAKFDSFFAFVKTKTKQIRSEHHCTGVEYRVEVADGHVRLKAKAK
jgi:hypothetical protein